MTWFILSISSIITLAIAELSAQKILTRKESLSPTASAFLGYSLQALLTLPFLFFLQPADRFRIFESDTLVNYIAVVVIGALGAIIYLQSFKVKDISISIIFGSLSVVVSTTLGIYFFHESTSLIKFIGIGLILIAIFILNFKNTTLERNHFYGLLTGVLYGTVYILDKNIVQVVHPLAYIFWVFAGLAVCTFLINPIEIIKSLRLKSAGLLKLVLAAAVGYVLYNLLTFFSYTAGGEVGKVDAINNSEVFLIVLFEYFILKHTSSVGRKLITACIAFAGVIMLGLYR